MLENNSFNITQNLVLNTTMHALTNASANSSYAPVIIFGLIGLAAIAFLAYNDPEPYKQVGTSIKTFAGSLNLYGNRKHFNFSLYGKPKSILPSTKSEPITDAESLVPLTSRHT